MKREAIHQATTRRGLSLIEAMIASLIVATVLAAALQTAGMSARIQAQQANRATARMLARALMADIMPLAYKEAGSAIIGRETGETVSSKVNYDDVDDFHRWSESPPQERDGTAMAGMGAYQRTVAVEWVNLANLTQTSVSDTGAKRITVTVKRNNLPLATSVFVRTSAP